MRHASLALVLLASTIGACSAADDGSVGDDANLDAWSSSSWTVVDTMHIGETIDDRLRPQSLDPKARIVHPFYVGASPERPARITFDLEGIDDATLQVAVLSPLVDGKRSVVHAEGQHGTPAKRARFEVELREAGVHLLAVSMREPRDAATIRVTSFAGEGALVDAVQSPSSGALAGRTLDVALNPFLDDQEVELWTKGPGPLFQERTKIGSARSQDHKVTFAVGPDVVDGDDLVVVVPATAPGTSIPLDTGTGTRLWTKTRSGIRTDAIPVSDFSNFVGFSGVLPFFEGGAHLALVSAERVDEAGRPLVLGGRFIRRDRPGQAGMGLATFDASFHIGDDLDSPLIPHTGEVLAVGTISEQPSFNADTCFRFCNDLSGLSDCKREELPCPDAVKHFTTF